MEVRDMKGNPGIWERLSWEDLTTKEKELWMLLGWQQEQWDRNEPPPSAGKAWKDLNYQERSAAVNLGFTEEMWDSFEDE